MSKAKKAGEVKDVTAQDNKWAEELLKSKNDELSFLGWVNRPKGKSYDSRILLVSKARFYFATAKYKIEREAHLSEIKTINSTTNDIVTLTFDGWNTTLHSPQTDELINAIVSAHANAFPGSSGSDALTVTVEPSSRVRDVPVADGSICGGFIDTYRVWCDFYHTPVREDIVWDVTHLFTTNNITQFNLEDLELPLTAEHLSPLFAALRYNAYFTGLIAKNIPLDPKKSFPEIGKTLSCNSTITKVVLSNVGMNRDAAIHIAEGIKSNPNTSINVIDFSRNPIDDKGMTALAASIGGQGNGLVQIDLSRCGTGKGGMSQLGQAFRKNVHMTNTLSQLVIPGNTLDTEGSSSLASWLANPNKLQVLNIANTNANLETIMPALVRGCNEISSINVSGNKLGKKAVQSLAQYLTSTDSLKSLILDNTSLGTGEMVIIIEAIGGNPYLQSFELSIAKNKLGVLAAKQLSVFNSAPNIAYLNIAENDFSDEAMSSVCKTLAKSTSLTTLDISCNFSQKPTKVREQAIEDLNDLLASECPLERLIFQGNKAIALKNDLLPLIDAIGTNDSLLSLDISGHQLGNKGAMAIGKMLQTNRKLKHLIFEENGTTLFGFNALANGLERNKFMKEMPMPIIDIASALKSENPKSVQKCMNRLQSLLARNQNPKALKGGAGVGGGSFSQFSILSSGEREHVERLKFKIKSSNRSMTDEQKIIMKDAENNDSSMASIYNIAEAHQTIMADEITSKLKELAKDIMPVVDKHFAEMVQDVLASVTERYKNLDSDSIRRINTSISFGVQPLEEKKIEKILASAASAEIAAKSNEVFASALEIATDYIYEKLIDGLVTIVEEVKTSAPRNQSVALFTAETDESKPTPDTNTPDEPETNTPSTATPDTEKPAVAGRPPVRGRPPVPGGGPRGGRGARGGVRGGRVLPGGLDPSKMIGGRGFQLPPVGGRSPVPPRVVSGGVPQAAPPQASNRPAPPSRNNPSSTSKDPKKEKKGLFGRKAGKSQKPAPKPAPRKGGPPSMDNAPDIKKVKKPANDTGNLKTLDVVKKNVEPTTTLTHATRDRPMVAKARRPPTRRPRAKAD